MESESDNLHALALGTKLSPEHIVELALSSESTVMWRFDFADSSISWMAGMDELLGAPGTPKQEIRTRLREAVTPLTVAARAASVWQKFELDQQFTEPAGGTRWTHFRARTFDGEAGGGLLGIATDITDKYETHQELTDLADRYRLLVDLSPDAIAVHTAGLVTYANPTTAKFIGATSTADIVGRPITDFVHPDSVPEMRRRISSLVTNGAASELAEAILVRRDGSTMAVESISVRTTWNGQPAFQVIMRDVTAKKAVEVGLRYQAALVEHVSDAIIATTDAGVIITWNPAAEVVYGYSAAFAVGQPVSELVGATLDPMAIQKAGGLIQDVHRRFDGSTVAVRVSVAQMGTGYVLVCADETVQRRAEQHFATVVTSLEEGVIVLGRTGIIESVNPAAMRLLGTTEKAAGSPLSIFPFSGDSDTRKPRSDDPSAETRDTGIPQNGRVLCVHRADGKQVWLSLSCRSLDSRTKPPHPVVVSFTDITERRTTAQRLVYEATHDELTGLSNRTLVVDRLTTAVQADHSNGMTSLLFIDLDKFKIINDSLGHAVGDDVLRAVGERLRHGVRFNDVVSRLGGDEFAVVSLDADCSGKVRALAENIQAVLAKPIVVAGRQLRVNVSIGIVMAFPGDPRTAEDLLRDADVAMYQAKTRGPGRYEFFDIALRERAQRRLQLEQDLRAGLTAGQLWMAYQPVIDVRSGRMVGVEALVRWTHPLHGAISPGEFIPIAEQSELIDLIGAYTLRTTTREIAKRRTAQGLDIELAVNLSARQLDDPELVAAVEDALRTTGLPPGALCLEVTETALMRDPAAAAAKLNSLRDLGIRLAIDDFGTGYSSLAKLLHLPLDILKIDQSFVSELDNSNGAEVIVTSIIAMAHAVGLIVIAEGVETTSQLEVLRRLDCDQAQGFYFSKPIAPESLFALDL
jgi:diguanylate cyclase (GGDEF)-like protein/PAS domain S-box-containing protein